MWPQKIIESLENSKIVAVVVLDREQDAVPTAQALLRGGITHMEPALRTEAVPAALWPIVREVPEMTVGAGTVLSPEQVLQVTEIGAQFAVAPGFNPEVVSGSWVAPVNLIHEENWDEIGRRARAAVERVGEGR